ncbi:MAG: hypothetical protein EZS28_012722 [Streblomastix strix]|uniref:Uncharacterized protein n=1 Tax=Streblomastix strix TaxID=222440 RepID=A0A5J4WB43_9EUKA|nr:MAG: hypothetical protein EZS28_012722 [Streblomastix strix]
MIKEGLSSELKAKTTLAFIYSCTWSLGSAIGLSKPCKPESRPITISETFDKLLSKVILVLKQNAYNTDLPNTYLCHFMNPLEQNSESNKSRFNIDQCTQENQSSPRDIRNSIVAVYNDALALKLLKFQGILKHQRSKGHTSNTGHL